MKRWLFFSVCLIALALLSHGVVLPRFVWASQLARLQAENPGLQIELERVVMGLSHKPVMMLSGLRIKDPSNQDELELGLLRLHWDALASFQGRPPVLDQVHIKGLRSTRHSVSTCSDALLPCLHLLPLQIGAQAMSLYGINQIPQANSIDMEQAVFINLSAGAPPLQVSLEQLSYEAPQQAGWLYKVAKQGQWNLGMKIEQSSGEQLYLSARGQEASRPSGTPRKFEQIQVDVSGRWFGGLPWTGSLGVGAAVLQIKPGTPGVQFELSELRSYIRREDAPDTHQAAFSAVQVKGGLPGQDTQVTQGEWTFTHEAAEAWTFDLSHSPSTQELKIQGRTIAGSEGIPAPAQVRSPRCTPDGAHTPQQAGLSAYWAWNHAWFSLSNTRPPGNAVWALCPSGPGPAQD